MTTDIPLNFTHKRYTDSVITMEEPRYDCSICYEPYILGRLRFYRCGHGFCEICLEKSRRDKNCAVCRQPKGNAEPHPIYLTLTKPASNTEKAAKIAQKLGKITYDSRAINLERGSREVRKIAQHVDPDIARELLKAAQALEQRLAPLRSELELEQQDKVAFQSKIEGLEQRLEGKASIYAELVRARRELCEEKESHAVARETMAREMEKGEKSKELILRQRRSLEKKDQEIRQMRAGHEVLEKQNGLLKKKLHVLAKITKRPKLQPQDPEESLQIEPLAASDTINLLHRKSNPLPSQATASRTGFQDEPQLPKKRKVG